LRLSLYRAGVAPAEPNGERIVYDLDRGVAAFGDGIRDDPALVWEISGDDTEPGAALLSRTFTLEGSDWIVRCDRVDFPLGGIAHRHVHPGPGIRYLLRGEIEIETAAGSEVYGAGDAWFEIGPEPVLARASTREQTSFVRVLVLPGEWAGKRTIRYLEPVPDATPKQAVSILLEYPIALPQ
jgi:quercetin dioxygenase-like cupin family protein